MIAFICSFLSQPNANEASSNSVVSEPHLNPSFKGLYSAQVAALV